MHALSPVNTTRTQKDFRTGVIYADFSSGYSCVINTEDLFGVGTHLLLRQPVHPLLIMRLH